MELLQYFTVICVCLMKISMAQNPPHLVFIVADDLGWNDIGWHNKEIITPHLDKLAYEGVVLNSSYVQPVCTPSRTAFMTGYYPFHAGLQHNVILPTNPAYLRSNYTTLPEKLKELGYSTHMIGKWHLGFCNWNYTPTYRGFDSFYGYYNGQEDFYSHEFNFLFIRGLDYRDNKEIVRDKDGVYSTEDYTNRAIDIIENHDPSKPLYLYLPFQNVHAPLQVPKRFEDMYSHIEDDNRRIYSGMVTALDEAVGNITKSLQKNGFMDNLLLVFTTDNGGIPIFGGNNLPLRGTKGTLWEGGTKGAGFIYSKTLLEKTNYINTGMMHAVDWFPTLLHVAGGEQDDRIDGVNQWNMLSKGAESQRKEFIYNIDELKNNAAIRSGDWKLIEGFPGIFNDWYPVPGTDKTLKFQSLKNGAGHDYLKDYSHVMAADGSNIDDTEIARAQSMRYRLFNITADPTEHFDVASQYPEVVRSLRNKLDNYKKTLVPSFNPGISWRSLPWFHDDTWSPGWC